MKFIITCPSHPWTFELVAGLNKVGRNPTNDICIHEASVSSFHCEMILEDGQVTVRDLGSTNGSFLNKRPIQETVWQPGQSLLLGSVEFHLEAQKTAEDIHIAIPEFQRKETPVGPIVFEDGSLACLNHQTAHATQRCTKCGNVYCQQCVRFVGLAGSKGMIFCPACDGKCETIVLKTKEKKVSFMGRLTQTIRIFRGK